MVDAEREALTDDELLRVIARPGFSTAEQVTDLSGPRRRRRRGDRAGARGGWPGRPPLGGGTRLHVRAAPPGDAGDHPRAHGPGGRGDATPFRSPTSPRPSTSPPTACGTVRGREVIVLRDEVLPLLRLRDVVGLPPRDAAGQPDRRDGGGRPPRRPGGGPAAGPGGNRRQAVRCRARSPRALQRCDHHGRRFGRRSFSRWRACFRSTHERPTESQADAAGRAARSGQHRRRDTRPRRCRR